MSPYTPSLKCLPMDTCHLCMPQIFVLYSPHFAKVLQDNPHLSNIKKTTKPLFPGSMAARMQLCDLGSAKQKGSCKALLGVEWHRKEAASVTLDPKDLVWLWQPLVRGFLTHQLPDLGRTNFVCCPGNHLEAQPKTHFWCIPRIWKLCSSISSFLHKLSRGQSALCS